MIENQKHVADIAQLIKEQGIENIIVCPGSRNAPFIQVFTRDTFFKCHSVVDERSAAYVALGMARELERQVVIVTTSGTATLNLAPAIAEAFYQQIPLVVLTADRPSEWPPQFSNQVISQEEIFIRNSKHFFNFPKRIKKFKKYRNSMEEVNYVIADANRGRKGPVHINVSMQEPLYDEIPEADIEELGIEDRNSMMLNDTEHGNLPLVTEILVKQKKLLFIAGSYRYSKDELRAMQELTEKFQVTVLADNISNFDFSNLIANPDKLLASVDSDELEALVPDLVVTFGGQMVSKRTKLFVQSLDISDLVVLYHFPLEAFSKVSEVNADVENSYLKSWKTIENRAIQICRSYFSDIPFCNISVMRNIILSLPSGTTLHLGNSGAIRYSQLLHPRPDIFYFGNRGVSGIDGCLSTAVGAAMVSDRFHVHVSGDMSFVYDSNGMWNRAMPSNIRIIVLNDSGGNIFDIIDGPGRHKFSKEYQQAHHPASIQLLTEAYGLKHIHANDNESLQAGLDLLLNGMSCAAVLEVDTSGCENTKIYKNLFKALNK